LKHKEKNAYAPKLKGQTYKAFQNLYQEMMRFAGYNPFVLKTGHIKDRKKV